MKTKVKTPEQPVTQMRDGIVDVPPVAMVTLTRTEKLWKDVLPGELVSDGEFETWEAVEKMPDGSLKVVAVGDFSNTKWKAPEIGRVFTDAGILPDSRVIVITLPG